jgi:carboxylesterase type B
MGLYGWTSSLDKDTDANAGLHDGVVALEWTKKYISKFGGDPNQITAMGESAGAGLINLMLVSNGGEGTLPFNKVSLHCDTMV